MVHLGLHVVIMCLSLSVAWMCVVTALCVFCMQPGFVGGGGAGHFISAFPTFVTSLFSIGDRSQSDVQIRI